MNSPSFPVIGIGASAGGLDAFHSFFKHMPADCGMAFVVILHLPAERKSMLVDILSRWTGLRVLEGKDGTLLEPNCVYVPPPHTLVTISGNRLRSEASTGDGAFRPIDAFFDSLASELGERTVGLRVDSSREVLKLAAEQFHTTPSVVSDRSRGFVRGVARVGPRLLMLLDLAKVLGEEQLHDHSDPILDDGSAGRRALPR